MEELKCLLSQNIHKMNDAMHSTRLFHKEEEKKKSVVKWVFAVIGIIAVIAIVVYLLYRFFAPDYLDDFEDDLDDDYDDDFFDDEDDLEDMDS
jgi:hypothetical protein